MICGEGNVYCGERNVYVHVLTLKSIALYILFTNA